MLKRKIEQQLLTWKQTPNHKPLIIKGCRQCGKTFSVRKFCEENYENTVYIGEENNILTLPLYMGFLLSEY